MNLFDAADPFRFISTVAYVGAFLLVIVVGLPLDAAGMAQTAYREATTHQARHKAYRSFRASRLWALGLLTAVTLMLGVFDVTLDASQQLTLQDSIRQIGTDTTSALSTSLMDAYTRTQHFLEAMWLVLGILLVLIVLLAMKTPWRTYEHAQETELKLIKRPSTDSRKVDRAGSSVSCESTTVVVCDYNPTHQEGE